jgi:hypothetical protein
MQQLRAVTISMRRFGESLGYLEEFQMVISIVVLGVVVVVPVGLMVHNLLLEA